MFHTLRVSARAGHAGKSREMQQRISAQCDLLLFSSLNPAVGYLTHVERDFSTFSSIKMNGCFVCRAAVVHGSRMNEKERRRSRRSKREEDERIDSARFRNGRASGTPHSSSCDYNRAMLCTDYRSRIVGGQCRKRNGI